AAACAESERVGARARAEVEDGLALVQVGHRGRHAAPQRGLDGAGGSVGARLVVVQAAAEHAALAAARVGAATNLLALRRGLRRLGVAVSDNFSGLGQLSHAVSSFTASGIT